MQATEAIHVTCPNCDSGFRVKPEAAGRSVKCPHCQQPTIVDDTSALSRLEAPLYASPPVPEIRRPQTFQPRRYPALSVVRTVLQIMAGLAVLGWGLVTISMVGLAIYTGNTQGVAVAIGISLVGTLIVVCLLVAVAELINVLVDIQDNTHRMSQRQ